MAVTATPVFTDNVTVVASATLARGSTTRGTIDLRTKFGMFLFVRIGRQGTTALTNGVAVLVNRTLNNDAIAHPGSASPLGTQTAAASSTTVNVDSSSGAPTLNVASSTGFAAGDQILVGSGTAREEWGRVSKVAAGVITVDRNLTFTHTAAQADTVRNKADVFPPFWVPGGALTEVIFDYGDDTAGESVTVEAKAQTHDSNSIA